MSEQMFAAEAAAAYNENFSKCWEKSDLFESLQFMKTDTMRETNSPSSSDEDESGSDLSDLSELSDDNPMDDGDAHMALAR